MHKINDLTVNFCSSLLYQNKQIPYCQKSVQHYIITQVILAFRLVLAYDLLGVLEVLVFLNVLNFEFEPITILC